MSTGQTCTCGKSLPPAHPRADAWGRPVCNDCLSHEQAATWPDHETATSLTTTTDGPPTTIVMPPTDLRSGVFLGGAFLGIARPQGREGRR